MKLNSHFLLPVTVTAKRSFYLRIINHKILIEMTKKEECLKALQCLYLEVDATIADDIKRRVLEALDEANKNFVLADVSGSFLKDLAQEHINKCKDMVYKPSGRNAGNELEGDYGSWRDWEARLILFGRELLKNYR